MKVQCMIEKLLLPIEGYNYNVSVWKSLDGVNYWYCGQGKYFKTEKEAVNYKSQIEEV